MRKKGTIEILAISIITIFLGLELLREEIVNFINYVTKPSFSQLMWEATVPIFFIISGISFLLLKKWAFYLVRTSLLLVILIGFLETIFAILIGFVGLPSFLTYLMMLAAGVVLFLVGRKEVKEQFNKSKFR